MTFLLQVLLLLSFVPFDSAEHTSWPCFLAVTQTSSPISTFVMIPSLGYVKGRLPSIVVTERFIGGVVCIALRGISVEHLVLRVWV